MKVGSIKTYHNGSAYSMADIYDEKVQNVSAPIDNIDSDTVVLFRVNSNGQFASECDNVTWQIVNSGSSTIENYTTAANKEISFLRLPYPSYVDFSFNQVWSKDGYTIDGIFYQPLENVTKVVTQSLCKIVSPSTLSTLTSQHCKVTSTGKTYSKVYSQDVGDVLDAPFHFAYSEYLLNSSTGLKRRVFFLNGQIIKDESVYANATKLSQGTIGVSASYSDVRCAFLRVSQCVRWTDNFTLDPSTMLYSFGQSLCLNIRHNNQTYYAPLSTAKNSPCLCVRHNNTNYYTVNS